MRKEEISKIRLFLLDMDGTFCIGNKPFEFSREVVSRMKHAGKKYLFMTNNSSKSAADYVKKMERMGIETTKEDFLTSAQATARYLHVHYPGAKLYVCGTDSLKKEFLDSGFEVTEDLNKVDCIVIGYDTELNYKKLEDVCKLLYEKNLPYIATHPDYVCPTEYGFIPDCGSICDMIFTATGKRPYVIGKPEAWMLEMAMEKLGVAREETAVVGDRIYTDIKSGLNAGVTSILVMSGETTQEILDASEDKPDLVLQDCGELIPYL